MSKRITVSLPEDTAAFIDAHAHGNVSAYVDRAIRRLMLREALRQHPVPDWSDDFAGHDTFGPARDQDAT